MGVTFTASSPSKEFPLLLMCSNGCASGKGRDGKKHSLNVEIFFSSQVTGFLHIVTANDRISQGLKLSEKTYGHIHT